MLGLGLDMDALIELVESGEELDERHAAAAAGFLLDEEGEVEKKARFLEGLAAKGETALSPKRSPSP
ncbi:MAG: hypothetical protein AAGC74_14630, partial [Verrucomicrobiota bacterium]